MIDSKIERAIKYNLQLAEMGVTREGEEVVMGVQESAENTYIPKPSHMYIKNNARPQARTNSETFNRALIDRYGDKELTLVTPDEKKIIGTATLPEFVLGSQSLTAVMEEFEGIKAFCSISVLEEDARKMQIFLAASRIKTGSAQVDRWWVKKVRYIHG